MEVIATARLRSRNQMTLPAAVAAALGAGPGDRLHFLADSQQPGVVLVSRLPEADAGRSSPREARKHPYLPLAGPPDDHMAERVTWPDRWMSADGVVRPLGEMTTDHLWAVLGYLRWYGPELLTKPSAPVALDPSALRQGLVDLPIWGAIAIELRRRGEISRSGSAGRNALRRLQVAGLHDERHYEIGES
jgi:bifunctional DNA-binding transcriptional regulator/antitoxin component of YhaV-PrlF toxin-antitoxin module